MKIALIALALWAGISIAASTPSQDAIVGEASPMAPTSTLMLYVNDRSMCKLWGDLYRETRRGPSDIFPHSEWVLILSRKSCPGDTGDVITPIQWETRLTKAPRRGDSLKVPARF